MAACGRGAPGGWSTVVLAALVLTWVRTSAAHTDPPGATGTAITVMLRPMRADGITPVLPASVSANETIYYRATLAWPGAPNAAVEGGTLTIVTPDGVAHNVTPRGGIRCFGGTARDPASAVNGGRGPCAGAPAEVASRAVAHTFTAGEIAQVIRVTAEYRGGFAHLGEHDLAGVGTTMELTMVKGAHGHTHDTHTHEWWDTEDPAHEHEHAHGHEHHDDHGHEHGHTRHHHDRPTALLERLGHLLGLP